MRRILIAACLAVPCVSCVDMRWQDYDDSQFEISMAPGAEAYQDHVDLLSKWANREDLPPGLAAELGYYLALTGKPAEAEAMYSLELARHPECGRFILALRRLSLGIEVPAPNAQDQTADEGDANPKGSADSTDGDI